MQKLILDTNIKDNNIKATFYIITILFFSCGQSTDKTNSYGNSEFLVPYIIDTIQATEKIIKTAEMQIPINDIVYVGKLDDTINIYEYDRFKYVNYFDFQGDNDSSIVKEGLKLYVSKKQLLKIDLEDYSFPPLEWFEADDENKFDSIKKSKIHDKWMERPRNYIQAIPLIIFNPSNDTINLNFQDERVIMIQEAKDKNGEWKPIEFWQYNWCGNSYGSIVMIPKSLAIVKVFKYNGDFETEIRLKLKNGNKIIYSDSFKGKINRSQFEIPNRNRDDYFENRLNDIEYLDRIFLNK